MGNVYSNILDTIGGTPLVELKGITEGTDAANATVLGKLEFYLSLILI